MYRAVIALLVFAPAAHAGPILDFTGGEVSDPFEFGSIGTGWRFSVNTPITVTSLGMFDVGADGFGGIRIIVRLVRENENGTRTPLAATGVGPINSTPVHSQSTLGVWRFTPITPVTLTPGNYDIFAMEGPRPAGAVFLAQGLTTDPAITYLGSRLGVPEVEPGVFGPNFIAVPAAVPEPGTLAVFGLMGVGGLVARQLRRKRAA